MNHVYQLCLIALLVGHALAFIVGKSGQKQIGHKKQIYPRKVPDSGNEKRAVLLNVKSGLQLVQVKVHPGGKTVVKPFGNHLKLENGVITQIGAGNKLSYYKQDNHTVQVKVSPGSNVDVKAVSGQIEVGNKWVKLHHTKGDNFISKYLAIH